MVLRCSIFNDLFRTKELKRDILAIKLTQADSRNETMSCPGTRRHLSPQLIMRRDKFEDLITIIA